MLSSGANVIIWDKMLSSEANVIMVSSGANVIIWCYHVMLSSGMITPPFLFFLETSLTPLNCPERSEGQFWGQKSRGPLKMSREMAHKGFVPKKKLCPKVS